ncbi:MAG TPA: hypothetical protein VGN57_13845 [Pirellulaceae bacterium]|jgi:hypothetical protein|nr:hypothetical protein [Pirellulaceae bacterium]
MTEADRTQQNTLDDIDARQDEVLERLEALNRRVEHLLSDWRPDRALPRAKAAQPAATAPIESIDAVPCDAPASPAVRHAA